ncbi:MAG: type 4a pilus biogenesis protein PilO [Candidatus Paceibacterota bacterium]
MFRLIVPLVIILISVGAIFGVAKPALEKRNALELEVASYQVALQNAADLRSIRDDLLTSYNSISTRELDELDTLLPDSVDNVKLVITIDEIAQRNGLVFSNAKYDSDTAENTNTTSRALTIEEIQEAQRPYSSSTLGFTVEGGYANFTSFLKDLESSLRIIDISKLGFTAVDPLQSGDNYRFDIEINTYWLKNA